MAGDARPGDCFTRGGRTHAGDHSRGGPRADLCRSHCRHRRRQCGVRRTTGGSGRAGSRRDLSIRFRTAANCGRLQQEHMMATADAVSTRITTHDTLRERLLSPWPRLTGGGIALVFVLVAAYAWGLQGTQANPGELVRGAPYVARFLVRLMPPQWKMDMVPAATPAMALPFGLMIPSIGSPGATFPVPEIVFAIVETIQMALIGTTVAAIISLPFGLLAARNTSPHRSVYLVTRFLLNANRAIPEIIFALIFVAAVGLGPFSGVAALSIGAVGFMGKLYAE